MSEMPRGWTLGRLLDVVELHDNRRVPLNSTERASRRGAYPYYGANGQVDTIDDYLFDGDYILLAEDGGYFDQPWRGVAYEASGKFWVNNHAHILLTRGEIPRRFMTYALNELNWMPYVSGTTRLKLTQQGMAKVELPIPPIQEQRRIVEKLDQLFERTTSAREELAHIPTLVEHYKQAVLRKAFSGELTAEWREKHGRAEAEISTVGGLVSDIRYGTAKKCYPEEHGVAVLRIPNVSGGQIVLSDLKYAELEERELRKLALQVGDILIVRSNGSPELVGRPALVTEQAEGLAYAGYLIRLRPNAEAIVPDYLKLMLESPQIRAVVEVAARSTSGVHNINSEELAALSIPCPETDEQLEIVRLIQAAFEWIERVSGERDKAATLLDHLDSGLLSKAFKGELVPQDPADEPAERLLERIRSERGAEAPARRGRRARAGA